MRYEGSLYRPPSEAYSYILQVTIGCSHNRCTFCNMYMEKQFRVRPLDDVLEDLVMARRAYRKVQRIFLADGDALIVKTSELRAILGTIKNLFPECERVTSYASARDLLLKTPEELEELHALGLDMIYLGLESGSEKVLKDINKGVTVEETIEGALKAKAAGIKLSVTEITGLAGQDGMEEHALLSARALSRMNPEYIGLMTLTLRRGTKMTADWEAGRFKRLTPRQYLEEQRILIANLDSEGSVLRSNHISNYVQLRGTMNRDRDRMLAALDGALQDPELDNPYIEYLENL
ncbi:MAG: radical SAM protein [Lachnospiraceae bacterium]|nr:radical SAM protein [Lachnospiraceae bacterium]